MPLSPPALGLAAVGTWGAAPWIPWDTLQEGAGIPAVVAEPSPAEGGEHVLSHRLKAMGLGPSWLELSISWS